jgi:hypothetical protein
MNLKRASLCRQRTAWRCLYVPNKQAAEAFLGSLLPARPSQSLLQAAFKQLWRVGWFISTMRYVGGMLALPHEQGCVQRGQGLRAEWRVQLCMQHGGMIMHVWSSSTRSHMQCDTAKGTHSVTGTDCSKRSGIHWHACCCMLLAMLVMPHSSEAACAAQSGQGDAGDRVGQHLGSQQRPCPLLPVTPPAPPQLPNLAAAAPEATYKHITHHT